MTAIQLTADQANAFEQIKAFLHSSEPTFVLGGHAGTGKTTLIPFVVDEAQKLWGQRSVILTAPTNKAKKVLRSMAQAADIDVECYTIHKANGLRLADDAEKKYLVKEGEGMMQDVELVVVDEASMIGARMFAMIENEIALAGMKVLFVGDPYQLSPVNDGKMQAFERVSSKAILRNIMRQVKGHPVVELGDFFRRRIDGESPRQPPGSAVDEPVGVVYMRAAAWYDRLIEDMRANALERPGAFRALAYTNSTVDRLASHIRKAIYGEDVGRFVEGERVFTAAPYGGLHTDQEITILSVEPQESHPLYPKFQTIPLEAEFSSGGPTIRCYAPAAPAKVAAEGKRLAERAVKAKTNGESRAGWFWQQKHRFVDSFADLRSVHSITTHRSQGSTFDSVFVDTNDIQAAGRHGGNEYKFRLLYVACSRARNRVFIRD